MFSIRVKLLFLLLPITLLLLAAVGYFNFLQSKQAVERSVEQRLQAIVTEKESALIEYVELSLLWLIMQSKFLRMIIVDYGLIWIIWKMRFTFHLSIEKKVRLRMQKI